MRESAASLQMRSPVKTDCVKRKQKAETSMRTAIVNLGKIVTGDLKAAFAAGDGILMEGGRISEIGTLSSQSVARCDVVVDAAGTTAIPGLIDSHVHITFGDYTPRQRVVGYLESYLHGGTTTSITASEVHVPGRPKDPAGVKALALAARACFLDYRPGGMRVHAGSVILEPGLTEADLEQLIKDGLWLAKAGFGAFHTPFEYAPLMLASWPHRVQPSTPSSLFLKRKAWMGRPSPRPSPARTLRRHDSPTWQIRCAIARAHLDSPCPRCPMIAADLPQSSSRASQNTCITSHLTQLTGNVSREIL